MSGQVWTHLTGAENLLPAPLSFEAVILPFPCGHIQDEVIGPGRGGHPPTLDVVSASPNLGVGSQAVNPTTQPVHIHTGRVSQSPGRLWTCALVAGHLIHQRKNNDSTQGECA